MASAEMQQRIPGPMPVWIGLFTGPIAWGIHLVVCYLLVPFACTTGFTWVFHLTTFVTGVATLVAGWLGFRAWHRSRVGMEADASDWTGVDRLARRRGFMGLLGLFLSVLFLILILMESVGTIVLSPCQNREYGGDSSYTPPAGPPLAVDFRHPGLEEWQHGA